MVKVKLMGVEVEHKRKELRAPTFGKKGTRWYASIALSLVDETNGSSIAEWFYLIACSPQYFAKPFRKGPVLESKYVALQDEFNIDEIAEIAKQKMAKVNAKSWNEFYSQMKREFLHEE